jgi:four helix bundle protein
MMKNDFNSKYCERTKSYAIQLCRTLEVGESKDAARVVIRQILVCGTAVAADFRAATRAKSKAEYYSKICDVVEVSDEMIFWFEILGGADLVPKEKIQSLYNEAYELLKIFSATKKKLNTRKEDAVS